MTDTPSGNTSGRGGLISTLRRIEYFDIRIADASLEDIVDALDDSIVDGQISHVVALNPSLFVDSRVDPEFRSVCESAELVIADGIGVAVTAMTLSNAFPKRFAGADLMTALCDRAARTGRSVFLLGGMGGIADRCAEKLRGNFSGLHIAGTYEPPFADDTGQWDNARIVERIRSTRPDILFVGLGAPKQEKWIHRHREMLGVPVVMGVGGSFDIVGGRLRRAPRWMRAAGLEWFFRLLLEPRRLGRRYLIGIPRFLATFSKLVIARRFLRRSAR